MGAPWPGRPHNFLQVSKCLRQLSNSIFCSSWNKKHPFTSYIVESNQIKRLRIETWWNLKIANTLLFIQKLEILLSNAVRYRLILSSHLLIRDRVSLTYYRLQYTYQCLLSFSLHLLGEFGDVFAILNLQRSQSTKATQISLADFNIFNIIRLVCHFHYVFLLFKHIDPNDFGKWKKNVTRKLRIVLLLHPGHVSRVTQQIEVSSKRITRFRSCSEFLVYKESRSCVNNIFSQNV